MATASAPLGLRGCSTSLWAGGVEVSEVFSVLTVSWGLSVMRRLYTMRKSLWYEEMGG